MGLLPGVINEFNFRRNKKSKTRIDILEGFTKLVFNRDKHEEKRKSRKCENHQNKNRSSNT